MPIRLRVGDLASLGVDDVRLRSDAVADALQNTYAVGRFAAVSTKMQTFCIRSDDCNRLELGQIERQQVLLVLEQYHYFLRGFQCDLAMLRIVGDFFRVVGVDKR